MNDEGIQKARKNLNSQGGRKMNRRDFLKAGAVVLGAAAVSKGASALTKGSLAEAAGPAPEYEIYALKYAGPFPRKLAMVLWNEGWEENIEVNYYIWAIKGKNEWVVVDAGTGLTEAARRKLKGFINPIDALKRIGVDGSNVNKVIITHMHFDHVGGMEMFPQAFPKARFYIQKKEYDFWAKHPFAKRPPFSHVADQLAIKAAADLEDTDRLVLISGDQKIMPGIELLYSPGHTTALQTVAVNTAKGTAIVASDCLHAHRAFKENNTSILITDLIGWIETYDKLRAKATSIDLVFPGHDMSMATNYPKVAEDVTRLV
jgi:glyoxylase-like metal-dependent hydrolase (beta-lactamase superfamily II)